jgi:hypothetical protein
MAIATQRQRLMRRDDGVNGDSNVGVDQNVQTLIGIVIFSIVLATISVALRFLSRRCQKLQYKADDWLIAIALAGPHETFGDEKKLIA